MVVQIDENEWRQIKQENVDLRANLAKATAELIAVASYMPECWPDDTSAPEYVASLVAGTTDSPGHAENCECWR